MRKKKKITTIALTLALSMGTCLTAFAGWEQTGTTWKYQNQTNGTYLCNCWQWIDGNGDGIAESYYFDEKGNMLSNTTINGYMLNADGKWILNEVIQTKKVAVEEVPTDPASSNSSQGSNGSGSSTPQPQPSAPTPSTDSGGASTPHIPQVVEIDNSRAGKIPPGRPTDHWQDR